MTNLAARLCSEATAGQILVSGRVAAPVQDVIDAEEVGAPALEGLARPVRTGSVLGLRHAGDAAPPRDRSGADPGGPRCLDGR